MLVAKIETYTKKRNNTRKPDQEDLEGNENIMDDGIGLFGSPHEPLVHMIDYMVTLT